MAVKDTLQRRLAQLMWATAILYLAVMGLLLLVAVVNYNEHRSTCLANQKISAGQVQSLKNLVASSNEFRVHARSPHIRAFFENSWRQRTAALAKAQTEYDSIRCGDSIF